MSAQGRQKQTANSQHFEGSPTSITVMLYSVHRNRITSREREYFELAEENIILTAIFDMKDLKAVQESRGGN